MAEAGIPDSDDTMAVVIRTPISFGMGDRPTRRVATAAFYGDQPRGDTKTNPTRHRLTIVEEESVPALFRKLAEIYEQEGSLAGIAEMTPEHP